MRLLNEKKNKRKIDEESLQLCVLVKKATEKPMNQISNFEEFECRKSLNINQKIKRKLDNMKQVMDIEKLNKFNLSKKVVKKFGAKQKAGS